MKIPYDILLQTVKLDMSLQFEPKSDQEIILIGIKSRQKDQIWIFSFNDYVDSMLRAGLIFLYVILSVLQYSSHVGWKYTKDQ